MRITIHRGTNQIGGCVTEYEQDGWHLFVDFGEQLPGAPAEGQPLKIEGLTYGDISRSALLLTHHHGDHIGKIGELPEKLPIHIGYMARKIQIKSSDHRKIVDKAQALILKYMQRAKTFYPRKEFNFGPFTIMPISVDHSAWDAYAFRIEADGCRVFHTGDFRTHGFRSRKLPELLRWSIGHVDYVVCEGTNVERPDKANQSEFELQQQFVNAFTANKYNIVYLSSTNIDRLFSIYHAALRAGRPFYLDGYQKSVMDIVAGKDSVWGKSSLYQYDEKYRPKGLYEDKKTFRINEKFINFAADKGYVLVARANSRFDNLIERLPGEPKKKYLSMWDGYVNPANPAYNPQLAKSLGKGYETMHTSGHCDMASLHTVFDLLKPKGIIPLHTDNPQAFANLFADQWPVILLHDAQPFNCSSV